MPSPTRIHSKTLDRAVAGAATQLGSDGPYLIEDAQTLRDVVEAALLAALVYAPQIPVQGKPPGRGP